MAATAETSGMALVRAGSPLGGLIDPFGFIDE